MATLSESDFFQSGMLGNRYFYFFHDSAGKIVEVINTPGDQFLPAIEELKSAGSLAAQFDFAILPPKGKAALLSSKALLKERPQKDEFFTSLPLIQLWTYNVDGGRFLGRISFHDLVPNLLGSQLGMFVFADLFLDTLLGFNLGFYRRFMPMFKRPEQMLNLPLARFMDPSPGAHQSAMLAQFSSAPELEPSTLWTKDFSQNGLAGIENTGPGKLSNNGAGLYWENKGDENHYVTFLEAFDTRAVDFRASLAFQNVVGEGPCFILGERYLAKDRLPDNHGYFAGRSADEPKVLFKRAGYSAAIADDPGLGSGEHRLEFVKRGPTLSLYQDRVRLAAFCDPDFLMHPKALISLALRTGHAVVLRAFSFSTTDVPMHETGTRVVARLNNGQSNFCTLDRFYNHALSLPPFLNVAAFFLNDVTEMQDQITRLDSRYRVLVKRGAQLETLLKKYERREEGMIGSGAAISALRVAAETVARTDATVLIEGPTGSGKEMLAHYIHQNSRRSKGPFIKVDCSTVPPGLIESHLFGHEKGAFTGAVTQSEGMFEQAKEGTLFLDEVSNLNLGTQAKLLQFLNDFSITKVGGTKPIKLNVRCLAASNRLLAGLVKEGSFREDLFYRINVVSLRLPSLGERKEDIAGLCAHFLKAFNAEYGKKIKGFAPEALRKIESHGWPGNIRELRNVVQQAVIFCAGDFIEAVDLPIANAPRLSAAAARKKRPAFRLSLTERGFIEGLMIKHTGNVADAARELNISRVALYNFLRKNKMDATSFRRGFSA